MTIGELLQEKGLSRYRLSKISGVPWATLEQADYLRKRYLFEEAETDDDFYDRINAESLEE